MTRLYTVHDNTKGNTKIFNETDLFEFLMQVCVKYDFTSSDMLFKVNEYGPQIVGNRYVVTKQLDSSIYG